jgi:hypothetical protein
MDETAKNHATNGLWKFAAAILTGGLLSTIAGALLIGCLKESAKLWPFVVLVLGFWSGLIILAAILSYTLRRIWLEE